MIFLNLNCWFCNQNSRISIFKRNEWYCPTCSQYNGFNKEGDYNKKITEIFKESKTNYHWPQIIRQSMQRKSSNCLCNTCNRNQKLKVDKLKNFVPQNEETWEIEIGQYKEYLEKIYSLCKECNSKVQVEIRTQDGILKEYLLKLGQVKYFFQSYKTEQTKQTALNNSKCRMQTKPAINSTLKLENILINFLYIIIFFLATMALFFCDYEHNSTIISQDDRNLTFLSRNLHYLDQMLNEGQILNHDKTKLSFFLIAIYLLSFLTIIVEYIAKANILFSCFICLMDSLLIFMNYEDFRLSTYYEINLNSIPLLTDGKIRLNNVNIIIPLIQMTILCKLIRLVMPKRSIHKFESKHVSKLPRIASNNQSFINSSTNPFQSIFTKENMTQEVICQRLENMSSKNFLKTDLQLIKPSKFKPSSNTSLFSQGTFTLNSLNGSKNSLGIDNDDDSSSIVSGVTNLYLNKNSGPKNSSYMPHNLYQYGDDKSSNFSSQYFNNSSSFQKSSPLNIALLNRMKQTTSGVNQEKTKLERFFKSSLELISTLALGANAFIFSMCLYNWLIFVYL